MSAALIAAARAVAEIRPTNWEDDDDAEALAAWRALDAALAAPAPPILVEVEAMLARMAQAPPPSAIHRDVKTLGEAIGYGAVMTAARASWRALLGQGGGEFSVGPCHATVVNLLDQVRAELAAPTPAADRELGICAGCGAPPTILDDNLEPLCLECADGCRNPPPDAHAPGSPANRLFHGLTILLDGHQPDDVRDALCNALARAIQVEAQGIGLSPAGASALALACSRAVWQAVALNWGVK